MPPGFIKRSATIVALFLFISTGLYATPLSRSDSALLQSYPIRNAYELARVLGRYENGDFDDASYRILKVKLLNAVKMYIEPGKYHVDKYPMLDNIYKKLGIELYPPLALLEKSSNEFESFLGKLADTGKMLDIKSELRTYYTNYTLDKSQADNFKQKIQTSAADTVSWAKILTTVKQLDQELTKIIADTGSAAAAQRNAIINSIKAALPMSISLNGTDTAAVRQLESGIVKNIDTARKNIESYSDEIVKCLAKGESDKKSFQQKYELHYHNIEGSFRNRNDPDKDKFAMRLSMAQVDEQGNEERKNTIEVINQVQYEIAQASMQSSFRIPSQSEMIDALAIYLAGRIKQEAVMWFFEQIKRNTQRYELIREFFPNTIDLLQSNEVYEIPNMGAIWQYALSKDFMLLPRNAANSKWLEKRWPEAAKYREFITGTCDMADLMLRHYSYRDAINAMYLQSAGEATDGKHLQFSDLISMFYVINKEFFIPDSTVHYRMLNYSDYLRLNKNELILMLSLADIQYGGTFKKIFNLCDKDGRFEFNDAMLGYKNMQVILGKIEASVSAFEKVRVEFVKTQKEMQADGGKDWVYSTYSIWSSLTQMLDVMQFAGKNNHAYCEVVRKNAQVFRYAGMVYNTYDLITKRNYAGAVKNTLVLVDSLMYRTGKDSLYTFGLNDSTKEKIFHSSTLMRKMVTDTVGLGAYLEKIGYKDKVKKVITLEHATKQTLTTLKDRFYVRQKKFLFFNVADQYKLKGYLSKSYLKDSLSYDFHFFKDSISFSRLSLMASVFFENDRHAVQTIGKLSSFLNDAALAKGDKQLSKVMASYAMPPGSYKRKRNNWWSLDLNAYAGPYVGYEWLPRQNARVDSTSVKSGGVYGFSVPIGLSLSKTFGRAMSSGSKRSGYLNSHAEEIIHNPDLVKLKRKGVYYRSKSTLSVTLGIVDLGAVVSYRMTHTSDSVLPHTVKWEQFVSPSLQLSYAIAGTPLVFTMGAQYTPRLRRINDGTDNQYNAWRAYAGIFFDLPLLNLWERRQIVK